MSWWHTHPWRLLQTNLPEADFRELEPEQYVNDLESFHATVALINAAGISASYPTEIPWQPQNPWADNDKLSRIVELCHARGIRVLARADFSKVKESVYRAHPDWAFRTAQGEIMCYNGFVQTCPCGEYQQERSFEILRELFAKIPFDGLYCNMGGFQTRDYAFRDYGWCHCAACRSRFRRFSGYDAIPEREDWSDPVFVAYQRFQTETLRIARRKMVAFLKTFPRELCFDDEDYARIEASTELHRRLPHWQYHASSNCRVILGDGSRPIICSDTSVDYVGYALREMAVSPEMQKLRLWQNLANLGAPDYYLFSRVDNHLDRSGFAGVREVFAFHAAHPDLWRGFRNAGRVLLRRADRWVATPEERGWIRALTESHIPFAEILPTEFARAELSRYDLLLLPDSRCLPAAELEAIDAYVRAGGSVLLAGGAGLTPEDHSGVLTPCLRCQGIRSVLRAGENMDSALLLARGDEEAYASLLPETRVIGIDRRYLFLEPEADTRRYFRLVGVHPFGPPECCGFSESDITDDAGLYLHSYGAGRAATIPWYPGEFYDRTGFRSLLRFLADSLTLCGAVPVAPDISEMCEITLAENGAGDRLVQLVNGSGSFGCACVKPVPMEALELTIPVSGTVRRVETFRGGSVRWTQEGRTLRLTLDRLEEYEAIRVEGGSEA